MNSLWTIYILECSDGTYYTGITNKLEERVLAHNQGIGAKYTRGRSPVHCARYQEVGNKSQASRYEYRIKKCSRDQKEKIIGGVLSIETLLGETAGN